MALRTPKRLPKARPRARPSRVGERGFSERSALVEGALPRTFDKRVLFRFSQGAIAHGITG